MKHRTWSVRRSLIIVLVGLAAAVWLRPSALAGQESSTGFRFGFGWQEPGGDLGEVLDGHLDAEFTILVPISFAQIGAGANWSSFNVTGADESWSQIRFHALLGVPFRLSDRVHPYLEGRWTYRHLRPEDDRYFGGGDEVLRDFKAQGHGFSLVTGLAIFVSTRVALDFSGAIETFDIAPDLSDEGLGAVASGSSWRFQTGVSWFPTHRP